MTTSCMHACSCSGPSSMAGGYLTRACVPCLIACSCARRPPTSDAPIGPLALCETNGASRSGVGELERCPVGVKRPNPHRPPPIASLRQCCRPANRYRRLPCISRPGLLRRRCLRRHQRRRRSSTPHHQQANQNNKLSTPCRPTPTTRSLSSSRRPRRQTCFRRRLSRGSASMACFRPTTRLCLRARTASAARSRRTGRAVARPPLRRSTFSPRRRASLQSRPSPCVATLSILGWILTGAEPASRTQI